MARVHVAPVDSSRVSRFRSTTSERKYNETKFSKIIAKQISFGIGTQASCSRRTSRLITGRLLKRPHFCCGCLSINRVCLQFLNYKSIDQYSKYCIASLATKVASSAFSLAHIFRALLTCRGVAEYK